jgi:hypothetical protein
MPAVEILRFAQDDSREIIFSNDECVRGEACTSENTMERRKKVLQRFPKRCTGTRIDARGTSTHNPRNSFSRE